MKAHEIVGMLRRLREGDYSSRLPDDGSELAQELALLARALRGRADADQKRVDDAVALRGRFLECMPLGIFVVDREGRTAFVNEQAVDILGRGVAHDADVHELPEVYRAYVMGTDEIYPAERQPIAKALAGETATADDIEIERPDGRIPLRVHAAPVRDAVGQIAYAIAAFEDVSSERKLEAQFRQSQRLEAVGRLAGGIAHDFNNLLTVVLSYTQFVMESLPDDAPARADLQQVLEAAGRGEKLIRQLLAFSRKQAIAPLVLNLNEVVRDVERMLGRVLGEDIELTSRLGEQLGNVRVDPSALEQVLMNLAVNARDAMPDGGRLTIETANVRLDDSYGMARGAQVVPGRYVVLVATDDGEGMDEHTRAHIFEPFFSTKPPGEGTGLGLATCYGIVKQAGGYIWVYSELGRGTTFKVYFPRVAAATDSLPRRIPMSSLSGTETVLVAEDDEQVRTLATRALHDRGYEVLVASSGQDALRVCSEHEGTIDLLLTDVIMPAMSGRALATRAQPLAPGMRVLFMSGYTENSIVHHGVLEDGVELLQKPFTPDQLCARVREVLDSRAGT